MRRKLFTIVYGWVLLSLVSLLGWWQWHTSAEVSWGFWLTCLVAGLALVPVLWLQQAPRTPSVDDPKRAATAGEDDPPIVDRVNPYRGRIRSAIDTAQAFAAPVATNTSATVLSLVTGGALVTASVLVSALLRLPVWIEAELVLAILWLLGVTIFTGMLWRGSRLEDDRLHRGFAWTSRLPDSAPTLPSLPGLSEARGCLDFSGLLLLLLLGVTLAASFAVAELVMPTLFIVLYYSLFASVGRVVNDRHECRGRLLRSLLWGAWWTTVYVAPVALVVAFVGHSASLAAR